VPFDNTTPWISGQAVVFFLVHFFFSFFLVLICVSLYTLFGCLVEKRKEKKRNIELT
jgi:hypothetical protein